MVFPAMNRRAIFIPSLRDVERTYHQPPIVSVSRTGSPIVSRTRHWRSMPVGLACEADVGSHAATAGSIWLIQTALNSALAVHARRTCE